MSEQIIEAIDKFHSHLDVCVQCRDNPFGLCRAGSDLLVQVGKLGSTSYMIAQNDDPELLEWLANAERQGGGFISRLAGAALRADNDNYRFIRPVILQMRAKYTEYEPTEVVKQEIRSRS